MSIHVDVLAELNERKARQVADQLERRFGNIDVAIAAHVNEADIKAAAAKLDRQFDDIKVEVKADVDHAGFQRASRAIGNVRNEAKSLHNVIEDIGKTAFRTSRGLMTFGAPVVVKGLLDFVQVATQATQSLWLLPAAATAGAAGIGTLALATSGFTDTIKDIRDVEKFAADIQGLSPAASQAALSIRNLLPEFDALKNATQDAFFKGFGEQIDRLATTYLPTIQSLTTSIATSFNNMITNVADQLMTPETQASMQTTFANISQMFTNLEPVAGSLTRAFTDIAEVGSGFLPGLATDIAHAATSFENFIAEARASGDLARWIQEGIDAVKNLGAAAWELIQIFYRVFGPDSQNNISGIHTGIQSLDDTINSFNADMTKTSEIIGLVTLDTKTWATTWNDEMVAMQGPLGDVRDFLLDIPEALAVAFNAVKHVADSMLTNLADNLNGMADILPDKANELLFGTAHPKPFSFTPLPDAPPGGDFGPWQDRNPPPPTDRFSDRGYANAGPGTPGPQTWTNPQTGQRMVLVPGLGWVPEDDPRAAAGAGRPYRGPFDKPGPPPDKGNQPSDKDRLDAIKAGLDPSLYKVADPFAPLPGLPDPYAAPPGAVQGVVDPQAVFEAQQRVVAEAHDLEEDRKNRLALERDNESTAEEIADAKWKELEDATALQKAQADLGDKMRGTAKDVKAGSDELSAALDPDLGLGKGLAGLADNLVRFMGHMALAGPMAQWQQIINQNEAATGIKGGYGFLGMRGAENLGRGLSPLLGRPMPGVSPGSYTPGVSTGGLYPSASSPTLGAAASYGLAPGTNTGGYGTGTSSTFPPWVMALGQQFGVTPSTYPGHQESNRNEPGYAPNPQGLNRGIDWSGTPEAMQRFAQAMAGNPLAEQVIFNGPGGPVEAVAGQQRPGYFAEDLAEHGNHVHTRFAQDPTGAGGAPGGMPTGGTATFAGGSIPIPLPVTIVGMGAGSGAGIPGLPGGGGGAPGGGGGGLSGSLYQDPSGTWHSRLPGWEHLIQRESSGINQRQGITDANSGGNEAEGLFQITPQTWAAHGGTRFAPSALGASPQDQAKVAEAIFGANPSGSDWGAGIPGRENAAQLSGELRGGATAGRPGYTPGVGFVDSAGNPTGYNPGNVPPGGPLPVNPTQNGAPTGPDAFMPSLGGPGMGPTQIGSLAPPDSTNPGGEGFGIMPGGTISSAISGAADFGGFGGGAAAQTLMKLANRTIQYGGEMAGHAVEGLMQTFLPTGGSELAQNSWLTRIIGGISAAAPALPNVAGGALGQQQIQGPLAPTDVAGGQGTGPASGPPNINIVQNNNQGITSAESAAKAIADHQRTANAGAMAGQGLSR